MLVATKYIKSLLQKMNTKKAVVIDAIPPKLVKLTAELLSQPVTEAINMCIKQNNFPNNAKVASVVPWTNVNQINMIFQILDQSAS